MSDKPTRAEVLAEYLGATHEAFPSLFGRCPITDAIYIIAPDPLAPGTAADAWLGVLVRSWYFSTMSTSSKFDETLTFEVASYKTGYPGVCNRKEADPTPAIVRAMMAADSAFREKMEGAEG